MKDIWSKLFIGLFCGLVGFGLSEFEVVGKIREDVRQAKVDIHYLQKADDEIREQAKVDRESFDRRMDMVVRLIETEVTTQKEQITTERELIAIIKFQYNIK